MRSFDETFSIEIVLRHPSYNPIDISNALLRQPDISWRKGDGVADRIRQSSLWRSSLWRGSGVDEYEDSLKDVIFFLTKHHLFLSAFISGGGEGDIVLNHTALSITRPHSVSTPRAISMAAISCSPFVFPDVKFG